MNSLAYLPATTLTPIVANRERGGEQRHRRKRADMICSKRPITNSTIYLHSAEGILTSGVKSEHLISCRPFARNTSPHSMGLLPKSVHKGSLIDGSGDIDIGGPKSAFGIGLALLQYDPNVKREAIISSDQWLSSSIGHECEMHVNKQAAEGRQNSEAPPAPAGTSHFIVLLQSEPVSMEVLP